MSLARQRGSHRSGVRPLARAPPAGGPRPVLPRATSRAIGEPRHQRDPQVAAGSDPPMAIAGSAAHGRTHAAANPERGWPLDREWIEARAIYMMLAAVER